MNEWLEQRRKEARHSCERIAFSESREWSLEDGSLVHTTGGFFSIEGLKCQASHPALDGRLQPIINQPEIGILGFLVHRQENGVNWLLQAKNEPGNIGGVQLAPSVQATFSNYTRLHGGEATHYLEYFRGAGQLLSDSLQSEQGTRFLQKFNRNAVAEVPRSLELETPNFNWCTSMEVRGALLDDYAVNTDARSVFVTAPWSLLSGEHDLFDGPVARQFFERRLHQSYIQQPRSGIVAGIGEKINALRAALSLSFETCGLDALEGWSLGDRDVSATNGCSDLTVEHYKVHSPDRETSRWDQPLVRSTGVDDVVLFCQVRDGVLQFLLRPALEVGLTGGVELGASYKKECEAFAPHWLRDLLSASGMMTAIEVEQSDEGGRFMESRARYRVLELRAKTSIPEDASNCWVTLSELERLCRAPKLLTNEARSVVSLCLGLA